jgi:hypothetical protein
VKETPVTLISVAIGAFLAGTAFGYGIQQWNIKSVTEAQLEAARDVARLEERTRLGGGEDGRDCYADNEVFNAEPGQIYQHCSTGVSLVVQTIRDNNQSLQASVGSVTISGRPPPFAAEFGEFEGKKCQLMYSAATTKEPVAAIVSFQCS